jgi:hypothetical protein
MKAVFKVQSSEPPEFMLNRITLYLKSRGYSIATQPPRTTFKRGSLWGSLTSFNPAKWKARIEVQLSPAPGGTTEVAIVSDVNTTGQTVRKAEIDSLNAEMDGLAQVIGGGQFDLATPRELEGRAKTLGKLDLFLVLGVSILASLLFTFFVVPLIDAATTGLSWEDLLRTDTITRQLESILLPTVGGTITRLIATVAILVALFIVAFQPLRQRLQNSLSELLQAQPPAVLKAAHVALDLAVVLCILIIGNVSYNLVSHAPPAEQQRLIFGIVIGTFAIVMVAAVQQRRKKHQHPV